MNGAGPGDPGRYAAEFTCCPLPEHFREKAEPARRNLPGAEGEGSDDDDGKAIGRTERNGHKVTELQKQVHIMAETASKQRNSAFRIRTPDGLSRTAARFLEQHPSHAAFAVKIALEAAASQYEDLALPEYIPAALGPFVITKPPGTDMLGVSEAASRLGISRTTVYDWAGKGAGRVVGGISKAIDIIGDPELTWAFLTAEMPFADRTARPIDMLKDGRIEDVLGSAAGFGIATT